VGSIGDRARKWKRLAVSACDRMSSALPLLVPRLRQLMWLQRLLLRFLPLRVSVACLRVLCARVPASLRLRLRLRARLPRPSSWGTERRGQRRPHRDTGQRRRKGRGKRWRDH